MPYDDCCLFILSKVFPFAAPESPKCNVVTSDRLAIRTSQSDLLLKF